MTNLYEKCKLDIQNAILLQRGCEVKSPALVCQCNLPAFSSGRNSHVLPSRSIQKNISKTRLKYKITDNLYKTLVFSRVFFAVLKCRNLRCSRALCQTSSNAWNIYKTTPHLNTSLVFYTVFFPLIIRRYLL